MSAVNFRRYFRCLLSTPLLRLASVGFLLAAVPSAHAANMFCCSGGDGVRICGDVLPQACYNKPYKEFNERGELVRSNGGPLTAAQKAQKEAELRDKQSKDKLAQETLRRDQALISTYATDRDLDVARARAMADLDRSTQQLQEQLDASTKRRNQLASSATPNKQAQLSRLDASIADTQAKLTAKKAEAEQTRQKFDADLARLHELRGIPAPTASQDAANNKKNGAAAKP
jgi:hypothetical protein